MPAAPVANPPHSIVDALCYVGPYSLRQPGTPYTMADLRQEHARYGIKRRLCLHNESRLGVAEEGNREMCSLAAAHPGTGIVWTVLPPRRFRAEPVDALMARAQDAGVAMFAMMPDQQAHLLAPWANAELYAAMESASLPLVLDARQATLDEAYAVAHPHPKMPLLFWDMPYNHVRHIVALMDVCPNVLVGLARNFVPNDGIEMFSERYGPGRLIFGSLWPLQSPGSLIGYVAYADVEDEDKAAIFGGNVEELLRNVAWPVLGFQEDEK